MTIDELENVKMLWIRNEQNPLVSDEKRIKELACSLGVFRHEKGIYRPAGRLQSTELKISAKYPIYLDRISYFTELIILDCHKNVKHCRVKDKT